MIGLDFTNPQQMGMMGLAAGLLQASGASRLPVTMGAGLGMGLQGYQQGAMNANKFAMAQAQGQQAQIGAKEAALQYPFMKAFYAKYMPSANGSMGNVHPMGTVPPVAAITQTPASAVAGMGNAIPQGNGATVHALPPQPSISGTDTTPQYFQQNPYANAENGASSSAPITANSTPNPAPSLSEEAAQLYRQGIQYSMVPGMAKIGAPLIKQALDLTYGPQLAGAKAAATSALAVDMANEAAARARGDTQAAGEWHIKALKDSGRLNVSSFYGTTTLLGDNGLPQMFVNPQRGTQMVNGHEQLIPGETGVIGQTAGAKAIGTAQGEVERVQRPDGSYGYVPRSAFLGNPGPQTTENSQPGKAGNGLVAEQSPQLNEYQKEYGQRLGEYKYNLDNAADAAIGTNYAFDQMQQALQGFKPGPGANLMAHAQGAFAAVADRLGFKPPESLTTWQEFTKYANQVAFAASRQLGSREAAQIVHMQMESNPNANLTPKAVSGLIGSMKAMNSYIIDKQRALQAWSAQNGTPAGFDAQWNQKYDPRAWDLDNLGPVGVAKLYRSLPPAEKARLKQSYIYYRNTQ